MKFLIYSWQKQNRDKKKIDEIQKRIKISQSLPIKRQ